MLKKLLIAAFALFAPVAMAANVPLTTGVLDPSTPMANQNNLILSLNANVDGLLGSTSTAVVSSGTSIQALATYTLPGGLLASVGQTVHIHAWGVNSADGNAKTVTFSFGGQTAAFIVTGSSYNWVADLYVMKSGASTQTAEGHAITNTTLVAPVESTWSVTDTAAITVLVEGTAATSGTITLAGSYIEQIK